jgi:hypothetical protein
MFRRNLLSPSSGWKSVGTGESCFGLCTSVGIGYLIFLDLEGFKPTDVWSSSPIEEMLIPV